MSRVLIELMWGPTGEAHDLDVPGDVPASELAELISSALDDRPEESAEWVLAEAATGNPLPQNVGLDALRLWDGTSLVCRRVSGGPAAIAGAFLLAASGRKYLLEQGESLLGRPHRGPAPGHPRLIDLSQEVNGLTVSREHAVLSHNERGWSIVHLPTARHSTLVNGRALAAGQPTALQDGDTLQLAGVVLRFHVGARQASMPSGSPT